MKTFSNNSEVQLPSARALKIGAWRLFLHLGILLILSQLAYASPPVLKRLHPWGAQRGKTQTLTLVGEKLTIGLKVITTLPGTLARLLPPKDSAEPGTRLPFLLELPGDAPVGLYPIRVRNDQGLSNILLFSVGDLPEAAEQESNGDPQQSQLIPVPVIINGTLDEGDRDYYRFSARAGQKLVFEVEASRAGSAIDPVIQILDSQGREIAHNNDAPGLGVDSQVEVEFPAAGNYVVQVHESRFSRQEQNFYRLKVGSFSYAEGLFPLGWRRGEVADVMLFGGNLEEPVNVTLDLGQPPSVKSVPIRLPKAEPEASLPFNFVLSDLPEVLEPGDDSEAFLEPSTVMNGRISRSGEVDKYRLRVVPGEHWAIAMEAASLGTSPLDGVITVYGPEGKSLVSVDDLSFLSFRSGSSFPASNADPRVVFEVPEGVQEVLVAVEDLHGRGGPTFGYRLQAIPSPDFDLEMVEPFLNVPANGSRSVTVNVTRHGYEGPIHLSVAPEVSQSFTVEGGYIGPSMTLEGRPLGGMQGILSLTARPQARPSLWKLEVWGEGEWKGQKIRRRARNPGMVTPVKGSQLKKDPVFGLRPANYPPVEAHWLGLGLPTAITRTAPVKLQVTEKRVHAVPGTLRKIPIHLEWEGQLPIEFNLKGGYLVTLKKKAHKIDDETRMGTVTLKVSGAARDILSEIDVVLQGKIKLDGSTVVVESTAFRLAIVPAYTIELVAEPLELIPGGQAELKGTIRREPLVSGPLMTKVNELPEHVFCPPVEIPPDSSELRVSCRADRSAERGEFEIELVSSAEIDTGKKKLRYSIPPIKSRLIVLGPSGERSK